MALPHIKNSKEGINREEPWYSNLFEVYFSIPAALQGEVGAEDVNVLTEQVTKIDGLDTLTKSPGTQQQTFMGSKRTYLDATLDDTTHELTIELNLNLRNGMDAYIFKLFKAWNALGYDISTGERSLKNDYVADFLRVVVYSRDGSIYKQVTYHDIILTEVSGVGAYDYTDTALKTLSIKFKSDWADDIDA